MAGCGTGHKEGGRVDRSGLICAEFKPQDDLMSLLPFRGIPDINICLALAVQPRACGVSLDQLLSSDKPQKPNVAKSEGAAA